MGPIILEIGALSAAPIRAAKRRCLGQSAFTTYSLRRDVKEELDYSPTPEGPGDVVDRLVSGEWSSVRLVPKTGQISWVLVFAPDFSPDWPQWWTMQIELRYEPWETLFNELLSIEGLLFVAASLEDDLDLEAKMISPKEFPWRDWRLIRGAVLEVQGKESRWVVKEGPVSGT